VGARPCRMEVEIEQKKEKTLYSKSHFHCESQQIG
jgi:hypothetical protein